MPHIEGRPLLALSGQTSIAVAYEAIRRAALVQDVEILVLLHDDLEPIDPDFEKKIIAGLTEDDFDPPRIVGVAGGGIDAGVAWWLDDPAGRQRTDAQMIDFGRRAGHVDVLEGSVLALSRWALERVAFDPIYPGFHGYDVDICMQVWKAGGRVAVVDVDTWHHTPMGFKTEQSNLDWQAADRIFREKWGTS
jgi:GT2 family glycosyltransferase